jgi:hypothetical protein
MRRRNVTDERTRIAGGPVRSQPDSPPGGGLPHAWAGSEAIGFTVARGRIAEIDILADPARMREPDLTVLDG